VGAREPSTQRSIVSAGGSATLRRYTIAALAGLVMNLALFAALQSLVGQRGGADVEAKIRPVFEFLRLRREEKTETKTRRLPERKPARPAVDSAPLAIAKSAAPGTQAVAAPAGDFNPGLALAGRPFLGAEGGDDPGATGSGASSEAIPLVRVNPLYPPRALARGIEGWVLLRFTISPQGTTKDIEILDANPKGYFERAATNAVEKYRYKPRIEDGRAVDWPGVQLVISFQVQN
jgi:protein TonB